MNETATTTNTNTPDPAERRHRLPEPLASSVIRLDDERYDELLYVYPTPEADGVTRDEMPRVRLAHNGEHFTGVILGYGTSYEESHSHVPGARPTQRCSGCRWTDVTILWAQPYSVIHDEADFTAPWQYCVLVRGRTLMEGETQRVRMTWTPDPDVVLDALYVPVPRHLRVTGRERNIAGPHEDALLDAAALDEGIARVAEEFTRDKLGATR